MLPRWSRLAAPSHPAHQAVSTLVIVTQAASLTHVLHPAPIRPGPQSVSGAALAARAAAARRAASSRRCWAICGEEGKGQEEELLEGKALRREGVQAECCRARYGKLRRQGKLRTARQPGPTDRRPPARWPQQQK